MSIKILIHCSNKKFDIKRDREYIYDTKNKTLSNQTHEYHQTHEHYKHRELY